MTTEFSLTSDIVFYCVYLFVQISKQCSYYNAPQVEQRHAGPVISVIGVEHIVLHSILRNQLQAFAFSKITRCNVSSGSIAKTHLAQTRLVAAVSGIEIANRTRSFPDGQSTFQ